MGRFGGTGGGAFGGGARSGGYMKRQDVIGGYFDRAPKPGDAAYPMLDVREGTAGRMTKFDCKLPGTTNEWNVTGAPLQLVSTQLCGHGDGVKPRTLFNRLEFVPAAEHSGAATAEAIKNIADVQKNWFTFMWSAFVTAADGILRGESTQGVYKSIATGTNVVAMMVFRQRANLFESESERTAFKQALVLMQFIDRLRHPFTGISGDWWTRYVEDINAALTNPPGGGEDDVVPDLVDMILGRNGFESSRFVAWLEYFEDKDYQRLTVAIDAMQYAWDYNKAVHAALKDEREAYESECSALQMRMDTDKLLGLHGWKQSNLRIKLPGGIVRDVDHGADTERLALTFVNAMGAPVSITTGAALTPMGMRFDSQGGGPDSHWRIHFYVPQFDLVADGIGEAAFIAATGIAPIGAGPSDMPALDFGDATAVAPTQAPPPGDRPDYDPVVPPSMLAPSDPPAYVPPPSNPEAYDGAAAGIEEDPDMVAQLTSYKRARSPTKKSRLTKLGGKKSRAAASQDDDGPLL